MRYQAENDVSFELTFFNDGDEITSDYKASYDIIFMDIEMKRLDGYTAAQKIRSFDKDVIIIFVTNMAGYAIKGYSVDALSFIVKPVTYFALKEELNKSIERLKSKKEQFIVLPIENGIIKQNIKDILFLESFKHYVAVQTKNQSVTIRSTMKQMEARLQDNHFVRCDNSYLVNLAYVDSVADSTIYIGQYQLKISRPRKKYFMDALALYMGNNL
jgi:DNA-binding LytR/AlgR family response regulator